MSDPDNDAEPAEGDAFEVRPVSFAELARWRDRALAAEAERERLAIETARLGTESVARSLKLAKLEAETECLSRGFADMTDGCIEVEASLRHARFMAAGWRRLAVEGRLTEAALMTASRCIIDSMRAERDRMRAVVERLRKVERRTRSLLSARRNGAIMIPRDCGARMAVERALAALDEGGA